MSTADPAVQIIQGPGFYRGLSYQDYVSRINAVRHSDLEGFRKTPAHARERMLNPKADTKATGFGHGYHAFMLTPAEFERLYAVPPKVDRRFKEDKAIWAEWEKTHPGVTAVTQDEMDGFVRMRAALFAHPTAAELMTGKGANELVFVWEENVNGHTILCKIRLDRLTSLAGEPFVVDLKTAEDASERAFARSAGKFAYFSQAAWYLRGVQAIRPGPCRFAFVAQEKKPPYAVAVHEPDERALEQGAREVQSWLEKYVECTTSGNWPAYDGGLTLIDYPPYLVDELD